MAMIDYGACLKINGKIVPQTLFMDLDNLDIPEKVYDNEGGEYRLKGNYFVYAGDKDFLISFYKCWAIVTSGDKMLFTFNIAGGYDKETRFFPESNVSFEYIDKNLQPHHHDRLDDWDIAYYHDTYKNKAKMIINRISKKIGKVAYYDRPKKYYAHWNYNGNYYEVIFGYGIDPIKSVYDKIKFEHYNYTNTEREFIDEWFEGE